MLTEISVRMPTLSIFYVLQFATPGSKGSTGGNVNRAITVFTCSEKVIMPLTQTYNFYSGLVNTTSFTKV